jgi:pyrimidine operon attenuation protein/uracil phosphoribosyltransferase
MKQDPVAGTRFCLYDRRALHAVVDRMAAEIAALLRGADDPLLLGILRRGAPLAEMLQARLREAQGLELPCYAVKLERYADNLALLHPDTRLTENAEFTARDISRSTVLIVDDVLYLGHSLARVSTYLSQRGTPTIRAAVLVDRCVTRLPVRADVVGIRLQVAAGDVVECHVPPFEPELAIELLRPNPGA